MYIACKVGTGDCQGVAADAISADLKGGRELDRKSCKACVQPRNGSEVLCLNGEVKLGCVGERDIGYGFNLLWKSNRRNIDWNILGN